MTSDCEWDPTIFDNSHDDSIYDSINFQNNQNSQEDNQNSQYDLFSSAWEYNDIDLGDFYQYDNPNIYSCIRYAHLHTKDTLSSNPILDLYCPHKILPKKPNCEKLRPNFGWLPAEVVKNTIQNTTQWYQAENRYHEAIY